MSERMDVEAAAGQNLSRNDASDKEQDAQVGGSTGEQMDTGEKMAKDGRKALAARVHA